VLGFLFAAFFKIKENEIGCCVRKFNSKFGKAQPAVIKGYKQLIGKIGGDVGTQIRRCSRAARVAANVKSN
jgi:hypothetical protein